jgi:hypothetical protein
MSEEYIFGNIGVTNTSIGTNTLANVTTGIDNTAFGTNALRYVTDGDGNSGFGINVMSDPSGNPSLSSAFGTDALEKITSGVSNSAFGYQALNNLTTGNNNVAFGYLAGTTLTDGAGNVLVGSNADVQSGSNENIVGIGSGDVGILTNIFAYDEDVLIGHGNRSGGSCVKVGNECSPDEFSFWTVQMGYNAGGPDQFIGRFADVLIGHEVFGDPDPDYFPATDTAVAVGKHAGLNCTESFGDLILGYQALQYSAFGALSIVLGARANQIPLTPNAFSVTITAVGYEAAINSIYDNDGEDFPLMIGAFAGNSIIEEGRMVVIGYEAQKNTRGGNNTVVGYRAFLGSTSYNDPDSGPGTAVGAGKLTSVTTTIQGSLFVNETVDIDFTGATSAGLDGTYFLISSRLLDYYVWYNEGGVSTDPGPIGSRTAIEVQITSGASESDILDATRSNVGFVNPNLDFDVWVLNQLNILDVMPLVNGDTTDISAGTATGNFKLYSVSKIADGTGGTPEMSQIDAGPYPIAEGLSTNYFLISSPTVDYYVWFNRDGYDTDPGPGGTNIPALVGKTGIEVVVSDSASQPFVIGQNILSALNGSGIFTASYPVNILRIVNVAGAVENVVLGNNAFTNVTIGRHNVVAGSDAGASLTNGRSNVLVGRSVDSGFGAMNTTVMGGGASTTANNTTVLGAGASSTADDTVVVGSGATVGTVGAYQIGPAAVSGAATLSFGSQTVSDEAWIGGGNTSMVIDNNGDVVRSTPIAFTGSTTDATPLSLGNWVIPINTARRIQCLVTGRRTGGTAGAINDSGVYRVEAAVKNNAGVISVSTIKEVELEDQPAWSADVAEPTVPDGSVSLFVTGALNNNVDWETKIRTFTV